MQQRDEPDREHREADRLVPLQRCVAPPRDHLRDGRRREHESGERLTRFAGRLPRLVGCDSPTPSRYRTAANASRQSFDVWRRGEIQVVFARMLTWLRRTPGEGTGRLGRWTHPEKRVGGQKGDVHALDVEDDPRGGVQSDAYRHADPREIVVEGDVAMSGPGGTPQGELEPDEVVRERDVERT